MDNWTDILASVDTPIRLIGLCILAFFVLTMFFMRGTNGLQKTITFAFIAVLLIGFSSLLVLKSPESSPAAKTIDNNVINSAGLLDPDIIASSNDRFGCGIVVGLTASDPFLNVRINPNPNPKSKLKDRIRNGQKLDLFSQSNRWYSIAYQKAGEIGDGWVH